jgi:hypothetical protein
MGIACEDIARLLRSQPLCSEKLRDGKLAREKSCNDNRARNAPLQTEVIII